MILKPVRRREMRDGCFCLVLAALVVGGCAVLSSAVLGSDDADGDGWYSAQRNERVTLALVGLTADQEGDYSVTVDGVRFPIAEEHPQGVVHARQGNTCKFEGATVSRAVGTWIEQAAGGRVAWQTRIVVSGLGLPIVRAAAVLAWGNRPGRQTATVSFAPGDEVRLDFRTSVETFADPEPNDAAGDADRDGLLDREEADYARRGIALGDPTRKDVILVVGHTHSDWRMTGLTKTLLRTCFHQRGVNLYLATNERESLGLCRPGLVELGADAWPSDHAVTLAEARRIRAATLRGPMSKHAHFVVLAARVSPDPGTAWGWAEMPGATLVVRSHLPLLGPDFHQYQAKTILHELGHNLGLCHPASSDERCPTGAIPEAERNSGSTVMGTPRDDRGDPVAVLKNAWARPLDYSPTQWKNARFDWVRPEKRPGK
jgi:hypothetical protein